MRSSKVAISVAASAALPALFAACKNGRRGRTLISDGSASLRAVNHKLLAWRRFPPDWSGPQPRSAPKQERSSWQLRCAGGDLSSACSALPSQSLTRAEHTRAPSKPSVQWRHLAWGQSCSAPQCETRRPAGLAPVDVVAVQAHSPLYCMDQERSKEAQGARRRRAPFGTVLWPLGCGDQ
jgi:hypothetical protein